jgi:beta-barrel assembly-enhancing protease
MNLSYKARYYTGHASKPYMVDVSMDASGITISYTNESQAYQHIHWEKTAIIESDYSSAQIVLRYGATFPYQQLEVTDADFIASYREYFKPKGVQNWLHFSNIGMVGVLFLAFVATIVLGYFYVLPLVADHLADNFPVEYEISMGTKMYDQILTDSKIDTIKTEAINHFFHLLHTDNRYPVKITVIKDSIVNAYALPGGGIIVYDAILHKMKNSAELAALLSHEYSHITLKHTTRNVFRSIAGYLFISVIFSDANGLANLVIDNANKLRNLSYSRELEHEADENGLHILQSNHIAPTGMVQLFETLKKQNDIQIDEIISTHPDLDNRIDFVKQYTAEHPYKLLHNDSLNFYFNQLTSH